MTGNLLGTVLDSSGNVQMGATVQLLNRYERVLAKAITASDGRFVFASLPLNTYAIRVSQPSFLPAFRDKIAIQAGSDSVLRIYLATLFSNIQVSYKLPSGAMTNDWKWVLRTSVATRPVTRFLPKEMTSRVEDANPRVFSDTHGMLSLSGGDSGLTDTGFLRPDLGSGFAVSTNLFGRNQVQVAGSYGQNADLTPAGISLAAVYSHDSRDSLTNTPQVTLTVSQFSRFGSPFTGNSQIPGLHTMSLSLYEVADPFESLHLEYGVTGESVDYLQHTARLSPFARVTVNFGSATNLVAAYSDGGRPNELLSHTPQTMNEIGQPVEPDLAGAVNALGRLPQISLRDGRLRLQRTQNYELGFSRKSGSRVYAVSGFYEHVFNGRLNAAGNLGGLDQGDLLFDGMSATSTYNIGEYARTGYIGTITQSLGDHLEGQASFGRMGGFGVDPKRLDSLASSQQSFLISNDRNIADVVLRASVPHFGTRIDAGYGWVEAGSILPTHLFTTQRTFVAPGLNFAVKQPLPSMFGMPGRLELTADLRNLLAQGYVPVGASGSGQLLIVQAPRAIRGGLNFTF